MKLHPVQSHLTDVRELATGSLRSRRWGLFSNFVERTAGINDAMMLTEDSVIDNSEQALVYHSPPTSIRWR